MDRRTSPSSRTTRSLLGASWLAASALGCVRTETYGPLYSVPSNDPAIRDLTVQGYERPADHYGSVGSEIRVAFESAETRSFELELHASPSCDGDLGRVTERGETTASGSRHQGTVLVIGRLADVGGGRTALVVRREPFDHSPVLACFVIP